MVLNYHHFPCDGKWTERKRMSLLAFIIVVVIVAVAEYLNTKERP